MRYVARLFVWSVLAACCYGVYLAATSEAGRTFWDTIRGKGAEVRKPGVEDTASDAIHSGKLYEAAKHPGQVR